MYGMLSVICVLLVSGLQYGITQPSECPTEQLQGCVDDANFTFTNFKHYETVHDYCGSNFDQFKSCMEHPRDKCNTDQMQQSDALFQTLKYVCSGDNLAALMNFSACLTHVKLETKIGYCQQMYPFPTIRNSQKCTLASDYMTCIRWSVWTQCGKMAADYYIRIEEHVVNTTLGNTTCPSNNYEAPAGVIWSYVQAASGFWSPAKSQIMRVYGDPVDWVPRYITNGTSYKGYINHNSNSVLFGHLAADYWHNVLVWVDMNGVSANTIPIYFTNSVVNRIIYSGLSDTVTAIALDWSSQNLYWTDAGNKSIGVVSYKPGYLGHHKILFTKKDGLEEPSGIITDPRNGKLYWADASRGVIQSSALSGLRKDTIQTGRARPTVMDIDYENGMVLWLEDGGNQIAFYEIHTARSGIFMKNGLKMLDLRVYEEYVFAIVAEDEMIIIDKKNKNVSATIGLDEQLNIQTTYSVTVSSPTKQYVLDNACFYSNGNCSQLCIYDPPHGILCACSIGFNLGSDGKTCESTWFKDNFLLIADTHGRDVYMLSLEDGSTRSIPLDADDSPRALAYNPESESVLYYEQGAGVLKELSRTQGSPTVIFTFGRDKVSDIAYDWTRRMLYYASSNYGAIKRLNLNPGYLNSSFVLAATSPAGITLDLIERKIYWTEWGGYFAFAAIYSADMDTGRHKLPIATTKLDYPTGLSFDHKAQEIFWVDAYHGKVESAQLDGSNRNTLLNKSSAVYFGLALDDQHLYISDLGNRNIIRYNRQTKGMAAFGHGQFQKASALRLYNSSLEEFDRNLIEDYTTPWPPTRTFTTSTRAPTRSTWTLQPTSTTTTVSRPSVSHTQTSRATPSVKTTSGTMSSTTTTHMHTQTATVTGSKSSTTTTSLSPTTVPNRTSKKTPPSVGSSPTPSTTTPSATTPSTTTPTSTASTVPSTLAPVPTPSPSTTLSPSAPNTANTGPHKTKSTISPVISTLASTGKSKGGLSGGETAAVVIILLLSLVGIAVGVIFYLYRKGRISSLNPYSMFNNFPRREPRRSSSADTFDDRVVLEFDNQNEYSA